MCQSVCHSDIDGVSKEKRSQQAKANYSRDGHCSYMCNLQYCYGRESADIQYIKFTVSPMTNLFPLTVTHTHIHMHQHHGDPCPRLHYSSVNSASSIIHIWPVARVWVFVCGVFVHVGYNHRSITPMGHSLFQSHSVFYTALILLFHFLFYQHWINCFLFKRDPCWGMLGIVRQCQNFLQMQFGLSSAEKVATNISVLQEPFMKPEFLYSIVR